MKQYTADAFSDRLFSGNPAAVCITDRELPDKLMLGIAKENNLSETAFAIKNKENYNLRWFTPREEIDLCGHATLAAAFVILNYIDRGKTEICFSTKSGMITVIKKGELFEMDFPSYSLTRRAVTPEICEALGTVPSEVYKGRDLLCILKDEETVMNLKPDLNKVKELDGLLLQVSAKGKNYDCVSRTFAPKMNISEDPVCGSGHCHIIPYWSERLKKEEITAYQASERGGVLYCKAEKDRIKIGGKAVLFSVSELFTDEYI